MKKIIALLTFVLMAGTLGGVAVANEKHDKHGQYQKPGAPIRLASPDFIYLDPHSSENFDVRFSTPQKGELTVKAKSKRGLYLEPLGVVNVDLASEPATVTLSLSSTEPGRYHVMFHATMTVDGQTNSRVFGIPVYVGKTDAASQKPKQHPSHIILPAEETIRPAN